MTSHSHHQPASGQPASSSQTKTDQVAQLTAQLSASQEREKKALADYQNLLRRTQQERQTLAQLAGQEIILALLEPLQHLTMTAQQLQSPVLDAVVKTFWQNLTAQGLTEVESVGRPFDPQMMEAVDVADPAQLDHKQVVRAVVRPGYKLNGQLIQVAKVVL